LKAHQSNFGKDGKLTNSAISEIYGLGPEGNNELEREYRAFCYSLGIEPRHAARKFWPMSEVVRPTLQKCSSSKFVVGNSYTRDQIAKLISLPKKKSKGNWYTGYSKLDQEFFLFANVGIPGRTGHDYANTWIGNLLVWYGKGRTTAKQPEILQLLSGRFPVNIFWRSSERAPFTFAGRGAALDVHNSTPVCITWTFEAGYTPQIDTSRLRAISRRGPSPFFGILTSGRKDGPTSVYVLVLEGPASEAFPHLRNDQCVIKVGMAINPEQRRVALSYGFPPGCLLRWRVHATREYSTGREAFDAESAALEQLKRLGKSIGSEFAMVTHRELSGLLERLELLVTKADEYGSQHRSRRQLAE
jgi:hypothetical protein